MIRKRIQIQGETTDYSYKNTRVAALKIIEEEGLKGMFKGIFPSYLKVIPAVSASYMALELTLKKLEN